MCKPHTCRLFAAFFLGLATGFSSIGCGGDEAKFEGPTGTVTGQLTLNKKAVGEGFIIIFTEEGERGFMGTATTDSDGNYTIKTKAADEMPVGSYKVSITPPQPESSVTPGDNSDYKNQMSAGGKKQSETVVSSIPQKYTQSETSGLKYKVEEGEQKININLTK